MTLAMFTACCGAVRWAKAMFARQPFENVEQMHTAADEIWWSLAPEDWLQAFSQHPKIGQKYASGWAAQEQSGMSSAARDTAEEMARLNAAYELKFGFIYIVCATGKTADQMLQLLAARFHNTRHQELRAAAEEQAKIMHLRLEKVWAESQHTSWTPQTASPQKE